VVPLVEIDEEGAAGRSLNEVRDNLPLPVAIPAASLTPQI
jgi:hypothetical protein